MGNSFMAINRMRVAGMAFGLLAMGCASSHAVGVRPAAQRPVARTDSGKVEPGPSEALKVHGHWTIEVRNPDSTVADHREFENALVIGEGDGLLAFSLVRALTIGGWQVQVTGLTLQICQDGSANPTDCFIVESTDAQAAGNGIFKNLSATSPSAGTVRLSGNVIAQRDGQIDRVASINLYCPPSTLPNNCLGSGLATPTTFTSTDLGSPVSVLAGQQVLVNVTFSFS